MARAPTTTMILEINTKGSGERVKNMAKVSTQRIADINSKDNITTIQSNTKKV